MSPDLRAGTRDDLRDRACDWVFVDVGFSSRGKTCGYLHVPAGTPDGAEPAGELLTFAALKQRLAHLASQPDGPLNLVLEAPLSAAFDTHGNPRGRVLERRGAQTRYWYVGLGCSVLVASLYLLQALRRAQVREVRLFEGLVSYKERGRPSDHLADVRALKRAVWSGTAVEAAPLDGGPSDLVSTLDLLGLSVAPPLILVGSP